MVSVLPGSGRIYCETFNRVIHSVRAASQQAEKMDFAAKPGIWIGERRYRNLRSNRNTKGVMEEEVVWGHSLDVPVFKFVKKKKKKNVTPWWNTVKSTLQNPGEPNQTFQNLSNICGIQDFRISTCSTTCTVLLLNEHNTSVSEAQNFGVPTKSHLECSERSLQNVPSCFYIKIYKSHVYPHPSSIKTQYVYSLMLEKISQVNDLPKNDLLKVVTPSFLAAILLIYTAVLLGAEWYSVKYKHWLDAMRVAL